ncbi:MAG: ribonuclease HIII [Verrucomicrobiaceae bacterium]|nr:ribonuclease HIII [Verrucomicrobiaceae bacterium]
MANLTTYTKPLTAEQAGRLRGLLDAKGMKFEAKPYCLYAASRPGLSVAVYEKGPKVVVQGKETEDFILHTLEPEVLGVAELGYEEVHNPDMFAPHIGVDESGKGDFFGPLVIAGAYVDAVVARKLREAGVMDSKRISSDARIKAISQEMKRIPGLVTEVVVIGPERYNDLYDQFGNLNRLLAWGHAKVIELLLDKVPQCPRAVSDQFANPLVLERALQKKGRSIVLEQRTKAESDPAVAAASILAREKFVSWLAEHGRRFDVEELPKGVSPAVKEVARTIFLRFGGGSLRSVAKTHFKTAAEVCHGGQEPPDG